MRDRARNHSLLFCEGDASTESEKKKRFSASRRIGRRNSKGVTGRKNKCWILVKQKQNGQGSFNERDLRHLGGLPREPLHCIAFHSPWNCIIHAEMPRYRKKGDVPILAPERRPNKDL
jgi:hypothetical protein